MAILKQPAISGSVVKQTGIATAYGFLAGVVAAAVLAAMFGLSGLIWRDVESRWYIFAVITVGGVLIAALRHWTQGHEADLAQQLRDARDPAATRQRLVLCLAASAIVAVAFGGSVGPEAGVLAVVAEMSALVALAIKGKPEQRLVGEAGAAAALSGIYGSPPGGALVAEEADDRPPRPLIFLAAVAGLLGFLVAGKLLLEGGGMRIHLPAYTAPLDGTDMLRAIPPAFLGGLAGLAFVALLAPLRSLLARAGGPTVQTLAGTLAFAALAAVFPILRFSGHHEMEAMLAWGQTSGMAALFGLALLKALALAVCLAAGWHGGAAFPLLFTGAAAGGAALWLTPSTEPTLALIAGMSAAITVGMGKPVAAMLVAVFLISPFAAGPLSIGVLVGYGLSRLVPKADLH